MTALGLALAPLLLSLPFGGKPVTLGSGALVLALLRGLCMLLVPLALLSAVVALALLSDGRVAGRALFTFLGLALASRAFIGFGLRAFLSGASLGFGPLLSRPISRLDGVLLRGASCIAGRGCRMTSGRDTALALVNHHPLRHHARLDDDPRLAGPRSAVPMILFDHPVVSMAVVRVRRVGVTDDPNIRLHDDEPGWWGRLDVGSRVSAAATGHTAAGQHSRQQRQP